MNINIRWELKDMENRNLKNQNIDIKEIRIFHKYTINKYIGYAYSAIYHNRQGIRIRNTIIIHEWNKNYLMSKTMIMVCCNQNKNNKTDEKIFKNLIIIYFNPKLKIIKDKIKKEEDK